MGLNPRSTAPPRSSGQIPGADWDTLIAGADALEVALSDDLRFSAWGDRPLEPTPDWIATLGRASTGEGEPFLRRFGLGVLEDFAALGDGTGQIVVYELADLYLAAREQSRTNLHIDFHALPFREPASGFVYARARWYDPSTASFLTADPFGYQDSSNLYAFAGNDPINRRDPRGEFSVTVPTSTGGPVRDIGLGEVEDTGRALASMAVGFIPILADAVDAEALRTGVDPITGQPLTDLDKIAAAAGIATPIAGAGILRGWKALKSLGKAGRVASKVARKADDVVGVASDVNRGRRAGNMLEQSHHAPIPEMRTPTTSTSPSARSFERPPTSRKPDAPSNKPGPLHDQQFLRRRHPRPHRRWPPPH